MNRRGLQRMTLVIAVCALVGALAGIAGSAAAPSKSAQAQKKATKKQARAVKKAFRRDLRPGFGPGGPGGPGFMGGPVHGDAVIPKPDGSGFVTVTTDAGTLNSVDGTTVHVKEADDKNVYKNDVAIDVGSDAKVIRDHADAKLSDLKQGDHVRVITGTPKGNIVIAEDDAFIAQEKKEHPGFGFGHHGFGPGGPPPGAPGDDNGGSNQNGSNSGSSTGSGSNS